MVRRRTHRAAIIASAVFATLVAVVLFRPGLYSVGPIIIGLSSLRNLLLELGAAIFVAAASAKSSRGLLHEVSRAAAVIWSGWTTGGRIFAVILAAKLAVTIVGLGRIADSYVSFHRQIRTMSNEPLQSAFARDDRYSQFAVFFDRVRRQLPPHARVLYVGHAEGELLAYMICPRPLFMQPNDRYIAWIEHQTRDDGDMPDDELFPKNYPPPRSVPNFETFIATHRITHQVTFVESDLARCGVEAIH